MIYHSMRDAARRRTPSSLHALGALAAIATVFFVAEATAVGAASQLYSQGDPLPEEQFMLQLVNRARANPAGEAALFHIDLNEGLASGTISPTPKQPLCFNPKLLQSGRNHSQWMLANSDLTHIETNGVFNGVDPGGRMQSAGYVFSGTWRWGENVAWRGSTGTPPPTGPTVASLHQDLFVDTYELDRGHRLNILDARYREIGIGDEFQFGHGNPGFRRIGFKPGSISRWRGLPGQQR